jgi:hypothetical protein
VIFEIEYFPLSLDIKNFLYVVVQNYSITFANLELLKYKRSENLAVMQPRIKAEKLIPPM